MTSEIGVLVAGEEDESIFEAGKNGLRQLMMARESTWKRRSRKDST